MVARVRELRVAAEYCTTKTGHPSGPLRTAVGISRIDSCCPLSCNSNDRSSARCPVSQVAALQDPRSLPARDTTYLPTYSRRLRRTWRAKKFPGIDPLSNCIIRLAIDFCRP